MKKYIILLILGSILLIGYLIVNDTSNKKDLIKEESIILTPSYIDLKAYFNETNGTAVFLTEKGEEYIYNEDLAKDRYSPYSSFKIVSTLMGLSEGIISNKDSTMNYDGTIYWLDSWNDNLNLKQAFENSCVWYYHQIINKIPMEGVQRYLEELNYGNKDISQWRGNGSNPKEELNGFWLNSSLKISPKEQVEVLKNIFEYETDFSAEDITLLQELMKSDVDNVYGKTGSGSNNSWYVGYFEYEEKNIYFATFIKDNETSGIKAKDITMSIIENWSSIYSEAYK